MKDIRVYILIFTISIILIFGNFSFAVGEELIPLEVASPRSSRLALEARARLLTGPEPSLNLNPQDAVDKINIGGFGAGDLVEAFKFKFPFDLNLKGVNIDTNIPISPKVNESQGPSGINLRQFLTPKDISSDDLGGAIKAIFTLIINIFLVVISITAQMLKLLLEFVTQRF